jgi:hypothetical protein
MDKTVQLGMKDWIFSEKAVLPEPEGPANPTCRNPEGKNGDTGYPLRLMPAFANRPSHWQASCQANKQEAQSLRCWRRVQAATAAHQDGVLVVLRQQLDCPDEHKEALVEGKLGIEWFERKPGCSVWLFLPH